MKMLLHIYGNEVLFFGTNGKHYSLKPLRYKLIYNLRNKNISTKTWVSNFFKRVTLEISDFSNS